MARIDMVRFNQLQGCFYAQLAAALDGVNEPVAVGVDAEGGIVPGAGNTGIVGVVVPAGPVAAGSLVPVVREGELVDFGGVAGTVYTADNVTGVVDATPLAAGRTRIGHTVAADRLVVAVEH